MNEDAITRIKLDLDHSTGGVTDWDRVKALSEDDIAAAAATDPDSPLTPKEQLSSFERLPNPKSIRQQLNMTQAEFAITFHLPLGTLRDWEQGKHQPDQASQTLLRVIAKNPDAIIQALKT